MPSPVAHVSWGVDHAGTASWLRYRDGLGGTAGDTADERVVYVYDSDAFPFFRAEAYHQVLVLLATDSSAVSFFY